MKIRQLLVAIAVIFSPIGIFAQSAIPEGYNKASITLANGTVLSGYIKDNIKKSSAVVFVDEAGQNKKTYEGSDINTLKTADAEYICISGDFFKTLCTGKLSLLQKMSNSSGKVSYNGTDAVFNSGTTGKVGEHLIYADNKLKVVNKKNLESIVNTDLAGCTAAIEKANAANGDIVKLQEAIVIYNEYAKDKVFVK